MRAIVAAYRSRRSDTGEKSVANSTDLTSIEDTVIGVTNTLFARDEAPCCERGHSTGGDTIVGVAIAT